jgi:hypothetical protein
MPASTCAALPEVSTNGFVPSPTSEQGIGEKVTGPIVIFPISDGRLKEPEFNVHQSSDEQIRQNNGRIQLLSDPETQSFKSV